LLKIRRLTRPGLTPVDLDIAERECIALGGPSGGGKSLLMRAIADLDPSEGEVRLDGLEREEIPAPFWRRQVVYVPAEAGWWEDRVAGHFPDPDMAAPLMRRLDLPAEALDWEVAKLSTGEKQRLALTRALLVSPKVLLLDEPTSGLDAETATKVEALLHERLAAGVLIMIVTHDGAQAERMASRRFHMEAGTMTKIQAKTKTKTKTKIGNAP
jgi:ABC-type iron transport system FetAB ATPase subunit